MSEKIKIENFIERLNNADFEQGTKFKFLDKIYLYDYPNLVGVYEIGKPTKSEYSIFSQLDMTNVHCEIEILKPTEIELLKQTSKADEMFKELGYIKQEGLREISYRYDFNEIILYKDYECFSFSKCEEIDYINMQELQAINQKCKELEWLDE